MIGKTILTWTVIICLACIVLKVFLPPPPPPPPDDPVVRAKSVSKKQAKLLVMRIYATTTMYRENSSPIKPTAKVGYVYDGSADIVVDLTRADFKCDAAGGITNLTIAVPMPELDRSTIGINPEDLHRVKSILRTPYRRQSVFTDLEEKCKQDIEQKQCKTFYTVDVIEDAKLQAQRVLACFYENCVGKGINVNVVFDSSQNLNGPRLDGMLISPVK